MKFKIFSHQLQILCLHPTFMLTAIFFLVHKQAVEQSLIRNLSSILAHIQPGLIKSVLARHAKVAGLPAHSFPVGIQVGLVVLPLLSPSSLRGWFREALWPAALAGRGVACFNIATCFAFWTPGSASASRTRFERREWEWSHVL